MRTRIPPRPRDRISNRGGATQCRWAAITHGEEDETSVASASTSKRRQNRDRHCGTPRPVFDRLIPRAGHLRLSGEGTKPVAAGPRPLRVSFMGVKQTGFDPSRAQAAASDTHAVPNQPPPPQGHVVKGAARGAALGAVGGAITGNAGTGAAAGAAMGGLAGGMRRRDQRIQQSQQQQVATQSAANSQQSQRNAYHRAMAACLTGRGYTVN
jgi:hypothetical protein